MPSVAGGARQAGPAVPPIRPVRRDGAVAAPASAADSCRVGPAEPGARGAARAHRRRARPRRRHRAGPTHGRPATPAPPRRRRPDGRRHGSRRPSTRRPRPRPARPTADPRRPHPHRPPHRRGVAAVTARASCSRCSPTREPPRGARRRRRLLAEADAPRSAERCGMPPRSPRWRERGALHRPSLHGGRSVTISATPDRAVLRARIDASAYTVTGATGPQRGVTPGRARHPGARRPGRTDAGWRISDLRPAT